MCIGIEYLVMSRSTVPINLPGGWRIPQGIYFDGKLNIFGWKISMEMGILKQGSGVHLFVNGECDPIKLGSFIHITRSKAEPTKGPLVKISSTPSASSLFTAVRFKVANMFDFEGTLFARHNTADGSTGFDLTAINVPMYPLLFFEVDLKLAAATGSSPQVSVEVLIKRDSVYKAINKVIQIIKGAIRKAIALFKKAFDQISKLCQKVKFVPGIRCPVWGNWEVGGDYD